MVFIKVFLLDKCHTHQKLFNIHGGPKFGALLIDLNQVFNMKFLVEIEFLAEDHPLIHVHLISRHLHLAEGSPLIVGLFRETFEGHLKIFVVEYFCFVGYLYLLFGLEHMRALEVVLLE